MQFCTQRTHTNTPISVRNREKFTGPINGKRESMEDEWKKYFKFTGPVILSEKKYTYDLPAAFSLAFSIETYTHKKQ